MSSMNNKSGVWNFFKYDDTVKVKCNLCASWISRGGTGKKASTTPLLNHLRNKHKEEYNKIKPSDGKATHLTSEFADLDSEVADSSTSLKRRKFNQQTLETVLEKKKIWDINHPKAVELHYAIAQMIAVDNQPYSFVEDEGFRNLMLKAQPQYKVPCREYFKQTIIPKMYAQCKEEVESMLLPSECLSITSDMWTNSVNKDSFISFTAHWIDNDYNYKHIVLNARHFPGSHNSENISRMLNNMIMEWNLKNKIYLVIRDSGSNIVKGVKDTNLKSESCFLHNLHLIVTDALNSQRAVKDIIATGRRIVGHFNHSSLACSRFKQIQEEQLHVTPKMLLQDISTRWNSTYYMLNRLLELKNAISLYVNENNEIPNFSLHQWTLIQNCLKLLQPFEEITKQISSSKSLISEVIPMVVTLNAYLSKFLPSEVSGVGTMKDTLKANIDQRFSLIQMNEHFSIATILDPRFKMHFFDKTNGYDEVVKTSLLSIMKKEFEILNSPNEIAPAESQFLNENNPQNINNQKSFWDCFAEITTGNSTTINAHGDDSSDNESTFLQEVNNYLSQPVIERKSSPFNWWKINSNNFPFLSKLVKKYLSPPASSIYSERLFSEAGIIYETKRNRILPQNAEQLLFLHHNLPIINNSKNVTQ